MQTCSIQDTSLKFSQAFYATACLVGFFLKEELIVLAVGILIFLGIFSTKLNLPYQFHLNFLKKVLKDTSKPGQRETAEVAFVWGLMSSFLLIPSILIYFGKFVDIGWIFILITIFLMFIACLLGFCLATSMYIIAKKIFKK